MSHTQKPEKRKRLPIGYSDFRELREADCYYVDKSEFIRGIIEDSAKMTLLPRPRRFGKTLNMSMLRYFFENTDEDRKHLFDGLAIRDEECFGKHCGKYPVIWITLKDVKHQEWAGCLALLRSVTYGEYARHRYLLESSVLFPEEKRYTTDILDRKFREGDDETSLRNLSAFLQRHHDRRVVILVDEYDTPLHSAYTKKYYDDAIGFLRNFLSGGLKDNEDLFRGVLTGILRVAKESVFSGLNNPGVYTVLSRKFRDMFGFTDPEVRQFLGDRGMGERYEDVAYWYNGYLFGEEVIYNPWSVLSYADNKGEAKPYWINTADTGLIDRLATRSGKELREEVGRLLERQES